LRQSKKSRKWGESELQQLHNLYNSGMSFPQIALSLGRDAAECKRMCNKTNWGKLEEKWQGDAFENEPQCESSDEKMGSDSKADVQTYVDLMIEMAQHNQANIEIITKKALLSKRIPDEQKRGLPLPIDSIRRLAKVKMDAMGDQFPRATKLGPGVYLLVGDCHGEHTTRRMFGLIKTIKRELGIDKIIHVGHFFDDVDHASCCWEEEGFIKDLIVLGMKSEMCLFTKENIPEFNVVRDSLMLGKDMLVTNQYNMDDHSSKFIGKLPMRMFRAPCVVNSHRHEMHAKPHKNGAKLVASPGCLCEKHAIRASRRLLWEDGECSIGFSMPGYQKQNRQEEMQRYWEQGMIIVEVGKDGQAHLYNCRVRKIGEGDKDPYALSYFDKIYTSTGVKKPHQKIFINGDMHCPRHDNDVMDLQEQFCGDYRPHVHVNVGDLLDNRALNHHLMAKTGGATDSVFVDDMKYAHYLMERMSKWAKKGYFIKGNHERFVCDFVQRFPQLRGFVDNIEGLLCTRRMGIEVIQHLRYLELGALTCIHGDLKMFGQMGTTKLERVYNNFDENVVMGNVHFPGIRTGCYSIGFSGKLDQGYNEVVASQWMAGFAYCNVYKGIPFTSLVNIIGKKFVIRRKTYKPKNPDSWNLPPNRPYSPDMGSNE
jgi:hypothetical protein